MDLVVYSLLRRSTVLPPSRPQVNGGGPQPVARPPMDFRVPTGGKQNGKDRSAEFPLFPLITGWDCKTRRESLSVQNGTAEWRGQWTRYEVERSDQSGRQ
ncbi:hypothetical protein M758_3G001200 [Ceratodon purpureus]|uniref:Uncharacterized protein n=1 Tax=Ceratodon purpureus TaxID=3225 RepID=A0A8T0ID60_CERPU|nr:hypothetical protein KC19_3G001000 [Ceratodon purpureus]KAG0621194.1 hypothetical protein M758_3G001200 [Ceratodon purpureus]